MQLAIIPSGTANPIMIMTNTHKKASRQTYVLNYSQKAFKKTYGNYAVVRKTYSNYAVTSKKKLQ